MVWSQQEIGAHTGDEEENIYQIQKLPALKELKEVELTLVTLDLMAYKPLSSVTIFIKLKNY